MKQCATLCISVAVAVTVATLLVTPTSGAAAAQAGDNKWHPEPRSPYLIHDYENHECRRPCKAGAPPKVCKYYFLIEHYTTLAGSCYGCPSNQSHCFLPQCVAADGVSRGVLTANRRIPGPLIYVCQHDTIEVVVNNRMALGEGTTIHWHGINQKGTPYMDGTALITQCPINSWTKMKYRFKVPESGTYFYHAHSSIQRAEGIYGGLVVRQPRSIDPHRHHYDYDLPEHYIIFSDWFKDPIGSVFVKDYFDNVRALPVSMLVNGIGRREGGPEMPRLLFTVKQGKRYRFRTAFSGTLNCPIYTIVDNHTLTIIATDGVDVEPVEVDSFMILSGERYDFIINANQKPGNYWIRFKGRGRCSETDLIETAILRYEGEPNELPDPIVTYENTIPSGRILNGMNLDGPLTPDDIQVNDLKAKVPDPDEDITLGKPDRQYYIGVGWSKIPDPRFALPPLHSPTLKPPVVRPLNQQFNYISNRFPPLPPLTHYDEIPKDTWCNNVTMSQDCQKVVCECSHLYPYKLGELIEVVLVQYVGGNIHPMHLHGHSYTVVGIKQFGLKADVDVEKVKALDARGEFPRLKTPYAPRKDTIAVYPKSAVIIRFRANNPGFWYFHCHIEFHAEVGMGMTFMEGDVKEMPHVPHGFPTCGGYDEPDAGKPIDAEEPVQLLRDEPAPIDPETESRIPLMDLSDSQVHKWGTTPWILLGVSVCIALVVVGVVGYAKVRSRRGSHYVSLVSGDPRHYETIGPHSYN